MSQSIENSLSEIEVDQGNKFGTFLGVFTPSLLTILGLIMYLRFGWVVANVGLWLTLMMVVISCSITFITALSASSVATNTRVGVGGEYFLISRSLGIETGGAIGIPLYFCRTLSVTFYCVGLAEAILIFWPEAWGLMPAFALKALAAFLILLVTFLSGKSASLMLKAQIPIMMLVILSIMVLALGVFTNDMHAPLSNATYVSAPEGFWFVFAVFFPAVTGFTAGIGMSGDLKDPRKSIPIGTIGAVVAGFIIYLIVPSLFAVTGVMTVEELGDPSKGIKTWTEIAFLGSLFIIPAIWGAIFSSAIGCILGAPRVLQALSQDGLAPKRMSKLTSSGQPLAATYITGGIALLAIFLGDLNTIAQFVSVLFLTLYATINLSAAVEDIINEPSYRPQIRVRWYVSLLGAFGAVAMIFLVNAWAGLMALFTIVGLYIWLKSRTLEQKWGDVGAGFWINLARYAMLKLKGSDIKGRNWRPFMLTFVRDINKRIDLVKLAQSLGQDHGILSIVNLQYSKDLISSEERKAQELEMSDKLESYGLEAFCEVHPVLDFKTGIAEIAKGHGLGNLRTNTVVFGWSENYEGMIRSLETLDELAKVGKNLLLCRFNSNLPTNAGQIDIWWGGKNNNGDLMLMLAYLLKLNHTWKDAEIRILSKTETNEEANRLEQGIKELLPESRINAEVIVIASKENFEDVLINKSASSDIVFLGLPRASEKEITLTAKQIDTLSAKLKIAVFVQNNEMSESLPILLKL